MGLSDFHKMAMTTMKYKFPEMPPKGITYKDIKNFDKDEDFRKDLVEQFKYMGSKL